MWSLALLAAVAVAFSPPRDPSRLPRALSAGSAAEEAPAIKLLSLDCTGTLFTLSASIGTLYHRGITRGLAGEFDVAVPSAAEIDACFGAAFKQVDSRWPNFGADDDIEAFAWFEAVARAALAGTPLAADDAAFDAAFAAVWELFASAEAYEQFEDGRRLLAWARSERPGLQVCAISNVHEVYRDAVLPRLGLAEYLDFGLYSRVEGVAKPDRALFDRAAARAGVDPSEVLHVGDHPIKDAAGARDAGCRALLLDRAGTLAPPDGVESISSLDDVRRWLEASSPNAPQVGERALADSHEGEREFVAWLAESLRDAPGRAAYPAVFDSLEAIVVRWRRRFRGNPSLWKRLMKARLLKEIVEIAPVIAATQDFIGGRAPGDAPVTLVDLASGKGFLAMFLSEMLPPERVERIFLVDRAWPLNTNAARADRATADGAYDAALLKPQQINPEHLYGSHVDPETGRVVRYADEWPIPLVTSKQDLKCKSTLRGMRRVLFERAKGPVVLLAVHLCGVLSHRAVDLFNDNPNCKLLALKPCCLPPMLHAERDEVFALGAHSFDSREVCARGSFRGTKWNGPPRKSLEPKFERWTRHLLAGIEAGEMDDGRKALEVSTVQVQGGFQNTFVFGERGPATPALWDGLSTRRRVAARMPQCDDAAFQLEL